MIFKRKSPETNNRRQPNLAGASDRLPTRTAYYSRRTDDEANLGRQKNRPSAKPKSNSILNFWLQRFGLLVLLVVILVSVVSAVNLNNDARIISLKSSGSSFLRDSTIYQKSVNHILSKSIWNRNKITIDTNQVRKQMLLQYPELSDVSVVLPLLAHRPVVYLTPSSPALVISGVNGSFILDINGKALLSVKDVKTIPSLKLPILTDQSGLKLVLGQRVLSSTDISFIQGMIAQLAAKHVVVSGLTLPVASREIDASIAGVGYIVKFNLQDGKPLQQAGTFLATKMRLDSQSITPSQYIDVRVPGRAYWQ